MIKHIYEDNMTMDIELFDESGDSYVANVPFRYEVCDRCGGCGKHSNPAIDGNGITASEWEQWDDEERETYLNGGYDVRCEKCNGNRVLAVVNEALMDEATLNDYHTYQRVIDEMYKDWNNERRYEKGLNW